MQIKGIDVSKHNGIINWSKVKSSGIDFVIIRAGYGHNTVDENFKNNIEGAIKANLDIGVYWFSYATSDSNAILEAKKCMEVIKPYKEDITYPVFYDFEYDSIRYAKKNGITINKTMASNFAKAFLDEVNKEGYISGLYTNIDFSNNYFFKRILRSYDLWIAQYTSRCSYNEAHVIWQFSNKGSIDGVNGNVDLNYCYKEYKRNAYHRQNDVNKSQENDNINKTEEISYKTLLIKELQKALNTSYNLKLVEDGIYGEQTKVAVEKHILIEKLISRKLDHTKWLQNSLKKLKYNITVDGYFGKDTENFVEKFQKDKRLSVDGIAGVSTHQAIIESIN